MQNIFVTADTHFDHVGIIHHCQRPFVDVNEMNETLVNNWNSLVTRGDITIIVGDFAWKNHGHWLNRLNGSKILVQGNHDKMSTAMLNQFAQVSPLLERRINNNKVVFCHYPMSSWNGAIHGSYHLYGHVHGTRGEYFTSVHQTLEESTIEYPTYSPSLSFDVGVDIWDFKPVPWEILEKKFKVIAEYKKEHPFIPDPILGNHNRQSLRQNNLGLF